MRADFVDGNQIKVIIVVGALATNITTNIYIPLYYYLHCARSLHENKKLSM